MGDVLIVFFLIGTAAIAIVALIIWYFLYRKNPWGSFSGL